MKTKLTGIVCSSCLCFGLIGAAVLPSSAIASNISASVVPSGAQRIQFARGATSAEVSGRLTPYASQAYLLRARAGQFMAVQLDSAETSHITIYGVDGSVLANGNMSGATAWQGRLPVSEDYVVQVTNPTGRSVQYTLPVSIR